MLHLVGCNLELYYGTLRYRGVCPKLVYTTLVEPITHHLIQANKTILSPKRTPQITLAISRFSITKSRVTKF
jgi:hypothetical protein